MFFKEFDKSKQITAVLYLAGVTFSGSAIAENQSTLSSSTPPSLPPVTQAVPLAIAPELDGDVLNDPAWAGATATTGFWQIKPFEGARATQKTEVFIGYTDDAMYIGAMLYDDDPGAIVTTDSRRDSSLRETDSFQVILDTYLDRQNGFVFGTNPAGMEYDGQVTKEGNVSGGSSGFNLNWDTNWSVVSRVGEHGWSVEMRLPFSSLRYKGKDAQNWGINFQRNIRRNNEVAFWSPLPRQYNLHRTSQAGTLEGMDLPAQRNLKVTPYVLGNARQEPSVTGTEYNSEFGVDMKWSVTPSLTLDATINTDFAQVEVDEVVVNLDRFSVFLPEKRPFFLENAGQFTVGRGREVELFFSRRIGISEDSRIPIDGGLRMSGKIGKRTNVGLLQMRTQSVEGEAPRNDYSVIRLNQELANRSSLGVIFVNRNGDGSLGEGDASDDYNRTYGVDGRLGIGEDIMLTGFIAKTTTPGLSGDDHSLALRGDYTSEKWSNGFGYSEVGENFNPEVGFVSRTDYRKADFRVLRRYRPENLWGLQELRPHVSYRGYWNFDGVYESGFLHLDNHWEFRTGAEVHTGLNFVHEEVLEAFEIVDGAVVQPGEYDNKELQLVMFSNRGAPFSAGLTLRAGGFFGGDKVTVEPSIQYRIGDTFNSELSWRHDDIDLNEPNGDFAINVGILKLSYSFSPKILLEALIQYDDRSDATATNLRFSWLQSASSGLYLVYNEIARDGDLDLRERGREFTLKYSYIFDLL